MAKARTPGHMPAAPSRRERGFETAGSLTSKTIRKVGEGRGFALTRLLTHWDDIAGPDMAAATRPVRVSFGREGFGATLILLVAPAHAPEVQMNLPRLRDRVNAAYGYSAVSRITLTQTAPDGFADGATPFSPRPGPAMPAAPAAPGPVARDAAAGIGNADLRAALELLAERVLSSGPTPAQPDKPGAPLPRT